MENSIVEEKMVLIPKDKDPRKGGLRTIPFIIVAAFRNRKLSLSHSSIEQYYHSDDSELQIPTVNLRYNSIAISTVMNLSFSRDS
ncbi:hypothetical protein D5086_013790 [Populus alba]|uniref:Uncharacterized protein n=1 Tax=Populus alba TaxID=43335 RepID=A0ACC4C7H7_POPAL